jgi:peptidoglycan/LPS O-acetylase OafA/YrhL
MPVMGYLAGSSLLSFVIFLQEKSQGYADLAVYPLAAIMIFLVAMARSSGPARILFARPLVWLGTVSYSIYMVHAAVLWFVQQLMHFVLHVPTIKDLAQGGVIFVPSATLGAFAVVVSVALTLAVSNFTYRWIEKPFCDWSKGTGFGLLKRIPQMADARS